MSLWLRARKSCLLFVVLAVSSWSLVACKKPTQVGPSEPMAQGQASVTVQEYGLVNLDLESSSGAVSVRKPVFRVKVKVSAVGDAPVHWDPGFGTGTATQARNVLLFAASNWEDGLTSGNNVSVVATKDYTNLNDPVNEPVDIAPGKSITDVLLFSKPPSSAKNLILSIPPRVFGAEIEFPGYISLPYSAKAPKELPVASVGKAYKGRGFDLTVTKVSVVHQKLKRADGEPAVSRDPLLRIDFRVKNTTKSPASYVPTMLSGGVDFPVLVDGKGTIQSRATFAANFDVVGQLDARTTIAPGKTIEDFILFDRPTRGTKSLTLQYPGKRLGGHGLAVVKMPYTWANPPIPKEFQPKNK